MAVTYTWDCRTVDTYPTYSDTQDPVNTQNDVIYNVHYILRGSETVDETVYEGSVIGTQTLSVEDLSNFSSFEELTHEAIVEWTKAALGEATVAQLEAAVAATIADKITPRSVTRTIEG